MQVPHTEPNTAFSSMFSSVTNQLLWTSSDNDDINSNSLKNTNINMYMNEWIEIFYSRPSWKVCQISYSTDQGLTWVPFGKFKLIDASDIRQGFRCFRIQSKTLHFQLANSNASIRDTNHNNNYIISSPGRYVIQSVDASAGACRRVSNAQIADCLRPLRPFDHCIEITFISSMSWRNAFITYSIFNSHSRNKHSFRDKIGTNQDNESNITIHDNDNNNENQNQNQIDHNQKKWFTLPMNKLAMRSTCNHHQHDQYHRWIITVVNAPYGIDCAFNDGAQQWDSNSDQNYHIRLPGSYIVGDGYLTYKGPSRMDIHNH